VLNVCRTILKILRYYEDLDIIFSSSLVYKFGHYSVFSSLSLIILIYDIDNFNDDWYAIYIAIQEHRNWYTLLISNLKKYCEEYHIDPEINYKPDYNHYHNQHLRNCS
jgi:hypothetical protein